MKEFYFWTVWGLKHDINKDIFTYNFGWNDNSYNFDAAGVFYPEEKES